MTILDENIQAAGDVLIEKLLMVSASGKVISLLDYLVELNIKESIFNPGITGELILADANNLVKEFPIIGEEILIISVRTPTLRAAIQRAFRIYAVVDRNYTEGASAQVYILEFCSIEIMRDIVNPVYGSFSGSAEEIVTQIYNDYLRLPATKSTINLTNNPSKVDIDLGDLDTLVLAKSSNKIKFVSPGWNPIRCINWICGKSEAENNRACNFLFWGTTKSFYFGNLNSIFENASKISAGTYYYTTALVNSATDVSAQMSTIKALSIKKNMNQLSNKMEGYLSSRLVDIDLHNKTFLNYDYDHTRQFFNYAHTAGPDKSLPLFDVNTSNNPLSFIRTHFYDSKLYTNFTDNFNQRYKYVYGNRRSNLLELDNFSMRVVIPGRTDVEAGGIIEIQLPKTVPVYTEDGKTDQNIDETYSGYYLITSLNHKINKLTHFITMDVAKDSLPAKINLGSA